MWSWELCLQNETHCGQIPRPMPEPWTRPLRGQGSCPHALTHSRCPFSFLQICGARGGKSFPSPWRCSDYSRATRSPCTWTGDVAHSPGVQLQYVPSRSASPGAHGSCSRFLRPVNCPAVSFIQQASLSLLYIFTPVHIFNLDMAKSLDPQLRDPQLRVKMLGLIEEVFTAPRRQLSR